MKSRTGGLVLTIYFYCRRYENKHTKVQIYDYADRYLRSWFPQLPAYANFNTRLNFLENAFLSLIPMVLKDIEHQNMIKGIVQNVSLIDSLPIVLCKGKRQGKVAKEISDKTYCASKNMYYCGVKLHVVANQVEKKLPFPNFISMTKLLFKILRKQIILLRIYKLKIQIILHNCWIVS